MTTEAKGTRPGGPAPIALFLLLVALSTAAGFVFWRGLQNRRKLEIAPAAKAAETPPAVEGETPRYADLDGPGYGVVPDFALVDQEGAPYGLADLKGNVWVAGFVFTYCAGPCPRITAEMSRLRDELQEEANFRLVSFSVDPARDKPAVLKEYASHYGGADDRWHLLSGDLAAVKRVAADGFRATAAGGEEGRDPNEITHSTRLYLVDADGVVRGRYPHDRNDALARLREDARALLARGKGAGAR